MEIQRPVNITNATPVLVEVETDVCGNVISYTETLTQTPTVGNWMPVQPEGSLDLPEIVVESGEIIVPPQQVDEGIGDLYASTGCLFTNGVASCGGYSPNGVASEDFVPGDDLQSPQFEEPEGNE